MRVYMQTFAKIKVNIKHPICSKYRKVFEVFITNTNINIGFDDRIDQFISVRIREG